MSYDGDSFADLDDFDIGETAQQELAKQAIRFQTRWIENLLDAGWVNTGEGVNSITVDKIPDGFRIGTDKIQVLIAEVGRSPGTMPPHDPISQWVHEQSDMPNKGESETRMVDGEEQTVTHEDVVFLVRRSIKQTGIEPIRAARNAWESTEDEYEQSVTEELE